MDNTPTADQFRPIVLRVLSDSVVRPRQEIYDLVADSAALSAQA